LNWKDVTAKPTPRVLRQFGLLSLIVFGGWGAWRAFSTGADAVAIGLLIVAGILGTVGLIRPSALGPVFTGWMIVAFPIGWVVSRVMLGTLFYLLFTPIAVLFRARGRDALQLKRKPETATSYWDEVPPSDARSYFRQS